MSFSRILGLLMLAIIAFPAGIIFASDYNFAAIAVNTLRYEPLPAQPGGYLRVWINVENLGTEPAKNLQVILEPKYPFELDPSENATRDIRTLEGKDNAYIDYKLRVADNAIEGENEITLAYSTGDRSVWVRKSIKIDIRSLDVNLDIVSALSEHVPPGGATPLIITLKNDGDTTLRGIFVNLDISGLPFYPINSTAKKKIALMGGGETREIEFELMVSPVAECMPYKVPVELSYQTLEGVLHTKKDYITLLVCAEPEIELGLDNSDILVPGKKGSVRVNIVNKGLADAKLLTLELKEGDYDIISAPQIYIGNLKSDDFDSADFDIYVGESQPAGGALPLIFEISYRDANNNAHSEEQAVNVRIYTQDELSRYGLVSPQGNTGLLLAVILLAAIGYWLYKRRKKKK
jgi:LPXTG-motif cell wall-anchored protein